MKTSKHTMRPLLIVGWAALSLSVAVAQPSLAFAGQGNDIVVPDVPFNLRVEEGNRVYREGHAFGTQAYICMPCPNAITPAAVCPASGFAWGFFTPDATLFDVDTGDDEQIINHFTAPNPIEGGKARPAWQDSKDTSIVWGNTTPPGFQASTDSQFVDSNAIAWLLLPAAGTQVGPTGGDRLADTTFIQRLNTAGGIAPDENTCASATDAGKKAFVPYTADYFFYKKAE